jgi:hypothetical protein
MNEFSEFNNYKVISAQNASGTVYFVIDVAMKSERKFETNCFQNNGKQTPLPLCFVEGLSNEEMLEEAFVDAINNLKEIDRLSDIQYIDHLNNFDQQSLEFILYWCASDKLKAAIKNKGIFLRKTR